MAGVGGGFWFVQDCARIAEKWMGCEDAKLAMRVLATSDLWMRWCENANLSANESLLDLKVQKGRRASDRLQAYVGLSDFRVTLEGRVFEGLGAYVDELKGKK